MAPAKVHEFRPFDQEKIRAEWESLQASGRPLSTKAIDDLAERVDYTSGKWMCFPKTGLAVDHYWELIATATVRGLFGPNCTGSKVRPFNPQRKHAICIHTKSYINTEEVREIESKIRDMGFKCELFYKPDVYTEIRIYGSNAYDFNLSSHRYKSYFHIKRHGMGYSTIRMTTDNV